MTESAATDTIVVTKPTFPTVEEIQQGWHELALRVGQLEIERKILEHDNKALRLRLERVIEHRQKSHGELIMLLTSLVGKLPLNDVGVIISKLVEHNKSVHEICGALTKSGGDFEMPKPEALRNFEQTKHDLAQALKTAIDALVQLDSPLETGLLRSLVEKPDQFFSPTVLRATRCFVKGQVPRERVVREFGAEALPCFDDLTTDPKLNPRPKPEEIVLAFKKDFEAALQQNQTLPADKRDALLAFHRRVQQSKGDKEQAQRTAFAKVSFYLELIHYYDNQNTEAPEGVFAQRLPALFEQLVVPGDPKKLDEQWILQAEGLLKLIINPDHRLMVVNNMGKGGGLATTLRFVLKLRMQTGPVVQNEIIPEFIKHLIPPTPARPPSLPSLAGILRLVNPEIQGLVVVAIMNFDKLGKEESLTLGRAIAKELGLAGLDRELVLPSAMPVETERQMAWDRIKDLITRRAEPSAIADAIRDRLRSKYDADEIRESWLALIQADAISLIRTFCHLPYLPDGSTDSIAKPMMETYVMRLTHEKYAAVYTKVVNSLRNMFKAKPDSPTLVNFLALVKWVDTDAVKKIGADIGMSEH